MTKLPDMASESGGGEGRETQAIHSALDRVGRLMENLKAVSEVAVLAKEDKQQAEEQGDKIAEELDSKSAEIKSYENAISEIEREIDELSRRLDSNRKLRSESKESLRRLNAAKENAFRLIQVKSENLEEFRSEFASKKEEIGQQSLELSQIIEQGRRKKSPGPESRTARIGEGGGIGADGLASLGDIHGWAPALFNYLTDRGLAEVSFCGFRWSEFRLDDQFKWRAGALAFTSPPGLDASPFRPNSPPTLFSRLHIEPSDGASRRRLVLIGDLIDRGDHSEVVVETVRQLAARAPGGCFSLIGNHEAMVILDDYKRWEYNEKQHLHEKGIKNRPFTVSHDPIVTGERDISEGMKSNFWGMRGSIGALLLTQHFALLHSLPKEERARLEKLVMPTWKKANLKHKRIEKVVNKGGWGLYLEGAKFLDSLCEVADSEAMVIPGALVSWYESGTFFLHAEPNGIAKIDHIIDDRIAGIGCMREPWKMRGGEVRFQLAAMRKNSDRELLITQNSMLWARSKDNQSEVKRGVEILQGMFPGLTNVVHGHTPQSSVTKLEIVLSSGRVDIHNIDESIGPNPRFDKDLADEYDIGIIPMGWAD